MDASLRPVVAMVFLAAPVLAGCGDTTAPAGGFDTLEPIALNAVQPLDATATTYKGLPLALVDTGEPSVTASDGVIGVVCVGMSNARIECDAWIEKLAAEWANEVSTAVRVVNCSLGGHAIEKWIDPQFDDTLWDACRTRTVPRAGLRADQVRVIIHKAANQFTLANDGGALPLYPESGSDYEAFVTHLEAFALRVPAEFPSVKAVYTSSRSYGGFANNLSRGEPLSYEEGHALNSWLASGSRPGGVWHGWGAYLWAQPCGEGPTDATGFCYRRSDFRTDGVHPSDIGGPRIAERLHRRLLDEAWYRAN